jgi:hypothetical protein
MNQYIVVIVSSCYVVILLRGLWILRRALQHSDHVLGVCVFLPYNIMSN